MFGTCNSGLRKLQTIELMKTYPNNTRYNCNSAWETRLNQPYDYEKNGLLKHLMSHVIIESKNKTLQYLLKYIEGSFIFLMKYIKRLQHFKDPAYSNR